MGHLNRKLIWERTDGGISITHLDNRDMIDGESEDSFIARYIEKLRPNFGVDPIILNENDIPKDRDSRNDWSLINGKIEVDEKKILERNSKKLEQNILIQKLGLTKEEYDKLP